MPKNEGMRSLIRIFKTTRMNNPSVMGDLKILNEMITKDHKKFLKKFLKSPKTSVKMRWWIFKVSLEFAS